MTNQINLFATTITLTILTTIIFEESAHAKCLTPDTANIKATWTAYKFTEKKAVSGTFSKIEYQLPDPKKVKSTKDLIAKTKVSIDSTSVESGDPGRNQNIAEGFFKKMADSTLIEASFSKVSAKKASLDLKLNGQKKSMPVSITETDSEIKISGTSDIIKLGLNSSFESIQKLCHELHKGKDGVSKTWSEFEINIIVPLKCN